MSMKQFYYWAGLFLLLQGAARPVAGGGQPGWSTNFGRANREVVQEQETFLGRAGRLAKEYPEVGLLTWVVGFFLGATVALWLKSHFMVAGMVALAGGFGLFMVGLLFATALTRKEVVIEQVRDEGGIPVGYLATVLDLIILLLLLFFGYRGFMQGLIAQFFSTGATLVFFVFGKSIFAAMMSLAKGLWPGLDESALPFAAFVLFFAAGWFFVFVLERVLRLVVRETFVGYLDSILGGVLGVVQATLCLSGLIWLLALNDVALPESYSENMRVYQFVAMWMPKAVGLLKAYLPKQAAFFIPEGMDA